MGTCLSNDRQPLLIDMSTLQEEGDSPDEQSELIGAGAPSPPLEMVRSGRYYETFYGHLWTFTDRISEALRSFHGEQSTCIWLCGDSSLDNKAWLFTGYQAAESFHRDFENRIFQFTAPALNGYETVLNPPGMVKDVNYWINEKLTKRSPNERVYCVNTAVEATTLSTRTGGCELCCVPRCGGKLLDSDEYIRDHIKPNDMIVCSIGGNDIALAPSILTVIFLFLIILTPSCFLFKYNPVVYYFVILFRHQVTAYLKSLTCKVKPKKIGVCCIYFLDEHNGESWANCALCCLGYCFCPSVLQQRIRVMFAVATSEIKISGTTIVPIALSDALDGKSHSDYVQRVEPSVTGGEKMASLIVEKMLK